MLNACILMGRLTADPELRTTQSGKGYEPAGKTRSPVAAPDVGYESGSPADFSEVSSDDDLPF